jgi:hypothetical protein
MRIAILLSVAIVGLAAVPPGEPPKPPIVSLMTLVAEQAQVENPDAKLNGNIASVYWEQLRADGSVNNSRLTKFDDGNHAVEVVEKQLGETRSTNTYKGDLLAETRGRTFDASGKPSGEEFWQTCDYDTAGRLLVLKRGRGTTLQNHLISSYDSSGRLIAREIRQGASDELVFTEQFIYEGTPASIHFRVLPATGSPREVAQSRFDEQGDVAEVWSREDGYHVRLKYDRQHRVVDQLTDPYALKSGCDVCPIPGEIRIRYDEGMREQAFFDPEGKPSVVRITRFEKDGSIASIHFEAPKNSEAANAPDLNRVVQSIRPSGGGDHVIETVWDDHGNWTEKKDTVRRADGTPAPRTLLRRKIVYR